MLCRMKEKSFTKRPPDHLENKLYRTKGTCISHPWEFLQNFLSPSLMLNFSSRKPMENIQKTHTPQDKYLAQHEFKRHKGGVKLAILQHPNKLSPWELNYVIPLHLFLTISVLNPLSFFLFLKACLAMKPFITAYPQTVCGGVIDSEPTAKK